MKKLSYKEFPSLLKQITDPPDTLYMLGDYPDENENKFLAVVGSRKYSDYGKEVVKKLISGLRGYNVVIVSGLALGIDSIAHREAINAGLKTIAIPGSGLNEKVLYPKTNISLARRILESGGILLSEFEPEFGATIWSFPQRNRIMAGISHAVLIIEAKEKSGTLITARLAMEYNRDVLTVPGSVFSQNSVGPHTLIQDGATPITKSEDILDALSINKEIIVNERLFNDLSVDEKKIVELLDTPLEKDMLIEKLNMPIHKINILLSALEIKGILEEKMGKIKLM